MDQLVRSDAARNPYIYIGMYIIFAVLMGLIIYFLILKKWYILPTPDNIEAIKQTQTAKLEPLWTGITQSKKGIQDAMNGVPNDERLLINASVMSVRLAGFLGPYESGVFDEATATRLALSSGARCLIVEIDYLEDSPRMPRLVYRDLGEMKRSLNDGSLEIVAENIAGRAFNPASDSVPPNVANDPLILVLYFTRPLKFESGTPGYMEYMGRVAKMLEPIKPHLLGMTPQGDFRKQQLESQLFFTKLDVFSGKIICLTNADLSPFKRMNVEPSKNLDLFIHARLYSRESPSPFNASSPESSVNPAAVLTTPSYWITTPPDRLADSVSKTKQAWTLVMQPAALESNTIDKENLTKVLKTYGAHSIPFCLFDSEEVLKNFVGKDAPYEKTSWSVKQEAIRFIPPKPIAVQKPSPQTNSGGGFIVSPSL
jgi:hypothetical protein